jgi:aldehyde:ferredoxin oxidoreductase
MPGEVSGQGVGGPEYETIAGFGAQCLMSDLGDIIKANDLCNRLGLDTISASGVIAFAMEAAERQLLAVGPGDPPLRWGDSAAILTLLEDITYRRGFGARLALGVKKLADEIGPEANAFAIHVKGLEFAYHDPRALVSLAVAYATYSRGACHRGCSHFIERVAIPELGYDKPLDRFTAEGKGQSTKLMQDYAEVYNSLKLCQFLIPFVRPSLLADWLNLVTGWDMTLAELLACGERSTNLKRVINFKLGLTREQDTLPRRILTEAFKTGGAQGNLPDLPKMLSEYYQERGWGPDGLPTAAKLQDLRLDMSRGL